MEPTGKRSEERQKHIEDSLKRLKSTSYNEYADKLKSGTYRTNRETLKTNRNRIIKSQQTLRKKEVKKDDILMDKLEDLGTLRELMDEEMNAERDDESSNGDRLPVASNKPAQENVRTVSPHPADLGIRIKSNKTVSKNKFFFEEMLEGENAVSAVNDYIQGEKLVKGKHPVSAVEDFERPQLLDTEDDKIPEKVVDKNEEYSFEKDNVKEIKADCIELFDPCTREPIENGDINILEGRVRDIKKQRLLDISDKVIFPHNIKTRLDLLLFILNRNEKPNEDLLKFNNNGQLYESYWDIVFTLGLIDTFPITKDFYMYNGKIETLTNIDGEGFSNNPLSYLLSKKINEGSKSGASDITFVYKKNKDTLNIDICSSDPTIKVSQKCKRESVLTVSKGNKIPKFYFCSSKFFNRDESKGVDKFDIQNIYTAAKSLDQEYERKIILLVKDKGAVEEKLRKAIRKYISEEASYVYGMTDLFAALTTLYDFIYSKHKLGDIITKETLITLLKLESPPKPILRLRLHQYLATYKICDAIKKFIKTRVNNKFLVGIVPRGGKTFIAGGIIDKLNPKRVVVLLGAKSETLSQFKKDLFEEFHNFQAYECIDVVNTTDLTIDPSKKYIFIMSVELYKDETNTRMLLKELKGGINRADLFICDEAHLKQTTARAVKQMDKGTIAVKGSEKEDEELEATEEQEESQLTELDKQIQADTPVVYMTGTYIKPLKAFRIPDENVVIWDYQDIQQAKELSTNEGYFKENFGELYDRSLQKCMSYGQTYETIQTQYQQFPELYLLTTQFTADAKSAFLEQKKGGYPTISHLFEVRKDFNPETTPPERWYSGFTNPKGMMRLINYLSPSAKQLDSIDEQPIHKISSILQSIDSIAQRIGDRLGFFTSDFVTHSQLWFLPHMQGHSLYKRMCALAGAIFQSPWFRKYFHVIAVSSSVKWNIPHSENNSILVKSSDGSDSCGTFSWACPNNNKSLKECLLDQEALARRKGKGLIILAQNMLHLGISLPCVDIVVLLDAGEKVDERIQKMYRALTESTNKKGAYIIDMNYFRTVTAIMNYQIIAEKTRKHKKEIYAGDIPKLFNKVLDIYSIDDDKQILRAEIIKDTLPELQKLLEVGKKSGDSIMLEDAGSALNTNIKNVLEKGYMRSYDEFLGVLKDEEDKQRKLREEGKNVKKARHEDNVKDNSEDNKFETEPSYPEPKIFRQDTTEQNKKDAYIDIFKSALKLGAFGTNSKDIKTLEKELEVNEELRETLYDTLIKRGSIDEDIQRRELQKSFIIDVIIRPGLLKMIDNNKNVSYYKMKESVEDKEKYPAHVEKVLDYIKDHLAPKTAERHKYGEVFTPMTLVREMLDTLPEKVWNDKTLKWLDPANGMGNYPIEVFLRLFYGFRTKDRAYVGLGDDGEGKFNPGLTKVISGDEARRKHIVQNMLFMVELNSKNNAIAKNLFKKLAPGVEPNIIQMHRKDGFLADVEMKFPNGTVNEFDIIMGNPPFNRGGINRADTRKNKKIPSYEGEKKEKKETIWNKFIIESFKRLKLNGFLLFIHPIGWFHSGDYDNIRKILLKKQIEFIKIYKHDSQSVKEFKEGSGKISIAYYLVKNSPVYKETIIQGTSGIKESVKLTDESIILLNNSSIINKTILKSSFWKDNKNFKHKSVECKPGEHKQISGIYEDGNIEIVKTAELHIDANKPKIIISGRNYPRIYVDNGTYGLVGSGVNYWIGDKLKLLEAFLKTKLAAFLTKELKFRQDFVEFKFFPDITKINLDVVTDKTLADYFGFTKEEREAINATEYPKREYKFKELTCGEDKKLSETQTGGAKPHNKTRKLKKSF